MTLGTTDGADDTFTYAGEDRIFSGTSDELLDICAHRHTGFCDQLDTVFRHSRYRRGIDDPRVDTHLHGFEHITTREVNGRSHLERQGYTGLGSRYQRMHHALDMTARQVVRLQSVALHVRQTRLMRLDHAIDDLRRRHLTDTHQEELDQTNMHTAHYGVDPQHKRYIIQENEDADRYQHNQNKSDWFHMICYWLFVIGHFLLWTSGVCCSPTRRGPRSSYPAPSYPRPCCAKNPR